MKNAPLTEALNHRLIGDWRDCYHAMHVHAVEMETTLTSVREQLDLLQKQLAREQSLGDALRAQIASRVVVSFNQHEHQHPNG